MSAMPPQTTNTNTTLSLLRDWRYIPPDERPHPREVLDWAAGEGGARRDHDAVVQLQLIDLLSRCAHPAAWIMRYALALPWTECGRCEGMAFEQVPDPAGGDDAVIHVPCGVCDGNGLTLEPAVFDIVRRCKGWTWARNNRGRSLTWHGLDYALRWRVGESTETIGDPPNSALAVWFKKAREECEQHGHLVAVDLACSFDLTCRKIGERLLGYRCSRCDGRGQGYFAVGRDQPNDAFRIGECTDCHGSGSIVHWWKR